MGDYTPVKGDRVRVVLEGTVKGDGRVRHDSGEFSLYENVLDNAVSVEKIEPPVVTFRSGDRIRAKSGGAEYTLCDNGYVSHGSPGSGSRNRLMDYSTVATQRWYWTSERFELVDLSK